MTPSLEGQDCHFVENDYLGLKCLKRNFNAKKITLLILNEWSRFDYEIIKWSNGLDWRLQTMFSKLIKFNLTNKGILGKNWMNSKCWNKLINQLILFSSNQR